MRFRCCNDLHCAIISRLPGDAVAPATICNFLLLALSAFLFPTRRMTVNQAPQWHPSPLIAFSFLLHAAMVALVFIFPGKWYWIVATILGNHFLLGLGGLWPRSNWLGPNLTCLPAASAARGEIALTIDDGPDPDVTPQVLDLLDRYGVKASFFCIGEKAVSHPELCKAIVERGHTVENHSQRHSYYFACFGLSRLTREIQKAQDELTAITGRRPLFFRAPAGLRNPFLDPALARLGLHLVTWTCRGFDTRTADPVAVTRRLKRHLTPGAILLMHDGNSARSNSGVPVIVAVLPNLLQAAIDAGLRFVTLSESLVYNH
jgi:peptidoglycan/xylan/chitin deacetylase (PgdA/CDA1 family)